MQKNQDKVLCKNGRLLLSERVFQVDKELKEEFLLGKPQSTSKQMRVTLFKVDEIEFKNNKKIYDFDLAEIENMISTKFPYRSLNSLNAKISHIKSYIDYCIQKGYTTTNNCRLIKGLGKYTVDVKDRDLYVTYPQLKEATEKLINISDKLILELAFLGLTKPELENLEESNIDYTHSSMIVSDDGKRTRTIDNIPEEVMTLLKKNSLTDYYIINNGKPDKRKMDLSYNPQKAHKPTYRELKKGNTHVFKPTVTATNIEPRAGFFQNRITNIHKWTSCNFTINTLRMSGIAHYTLIYKKANSLEKLNKQDYAKIYQRFYYNEPFIETGDGKKKCKNAVWDVVFSLRKVVRLLYSQDI